MMRLPVFLFLFWTIGQAAAQEAIPADGNDRRGAVETAWANLDSPEGSVRTAARTVIEAQPFPTWRSRALEETRPWASIEALWALGDACPLAEGPALRPHLCESITTLRIEQMTEEQTLAAVRLTRLVCTRFGRPTEDERDQMIDLWSRIAAQRSAGGRTTAPQKVAAEIHELLMLLSGAKSVRGEHERAGGD